MKAHYSRAHIFNHQDKIQYLAKKVLMGQEKSYMLNVYYEVKSLTHRPKLGPRGRVQWNPFIKTFKFNENLS